VLVRAVGGGVLRAGLEESGEEIARAGAGGAARPAASGCGSQAGVCSDGAVRATMGRGGCVAVQMNHGSDPSFSNHGSEV